MHLMTGRRTHERPLLAGLRPWLDGRHSTRNCRSSIEKPPITLPAAQALALIQGRKTTCVRLPPTDWARNPRQHNCAVDSRRSSRTAGSGVDGPTRLLKYAAAFASAAPATKKNGDACSTYDGLADFGTGVLRINGHGICGLVRGGRFRHLLSRRLGR